MIYRGPLQYHENPDNGDDDSLCEPEILDEAEIPLYNQNAELAKSEDLFLPLKKCVVWALLFSLVALAVGTTFYWKPCPSQYVVAKGTATPTRPVTRNDVWIQYTTVLLFAHYINIRQ